MMFISRTQFHGFISLLPNYSVARTLWRNGGTFVIKGVKTLEQDMSAALAATLMPGQSAR